MSELFFDNLCEESNEETHIFNHNEIDAPSIEIENKCMNISFGKRVISKTFSGYFGSIQYYIETKDIVRVEIDLRQTEYMNLFCISKIILTIMETSERIQYTIFWPSEEKSSNNKMLRFLYNKGILDLLFTTPNISNVIEGDFIDDFKEKYDFSHCIDAAIFPYKVYKVVKRSAKRYSKEQVMKTVSEVLDKVKVYFENKQRNSFENIKNRLYLYLYEIIENVYEHAYLKNGVYGILVTYDYLPKYLWTKDKKSKDKYIQRGKRLQKETPLSLFGDVEDTYIGGISVWVDDIGSGIAQTIRGGYYQQMYRDTYLNGLNEQMRGRGKTTLNGLKLIGDEIANNGDYLWLHDCWHWVGTHCNELKSTIALSDESRKEGIQEYKYPFIKGCSYDIKINLARNSKEKKNSFNNFGVPLHINFEEMKNLCQLAISSDFDMKRTLLIDLYNSDNHSKKTEDFFEKEFDTLLYRSRAIRKEQFKGELFERIFLKMEEDRSKKQYFFEELVVYDLSQTALFQIRALIETRDYSEILFEHKIKRVILLSTEFFVFVMEIEDGIFKLKKKYSDGYIKTCREKLLFYFMCFQKNDDYMVNSIISKNKKNMLICADIQWGDIKINQYLDIEMMLKDRQIFTILRRMLIRVGNLLAGESRISFIEEFLENQFSEYLNEFSMEKARKIYVGSLLLTKQTERKRAMEEDEKIYLFLHEESTVTLNEKYIFLFNYPKVKVRKQKCKYRRIEATHKIEKYMEESEEFKFYFTKKYEHLIMNINFKLGLYSSGLISIISNQNLEKSFKEFVSEQLRIILKKYNSIVLKIDDNMLGICDDLQQYATEIKESILERENRRIYEKKFLEEKEEGKAGIVIYITQSVDLIRLLELKTKQNGYIVISIFNEIKTEEGIDKLISSGYIPFIPIYHKDMMIIKEDDLKTFKAFYATLVPTLRREVETLYTQTQGSYKFDFLTELQRQFNRKSAYSVLYDAIMDYISYTTNSIIKKTKKEEEYELLLSIMLWAEQKVRANNNRDERLLETILTQLESQKDNNISILIYYCMLVLYVFDASLNIKIIEAHRDDIRNIFKFSINPFIKIIFANILEQWNTLEFKKELSEIFVGNDISLYYQTLYQNAFNNFGEDHDSVIHKYCKNNKELTPNEISYLPSLINESVSLLKLTKPYDESEDELVMLETSLKKYYDDKEFGFEFRQKCEELRERVKRRFIVLNVGNIRQEFKDFIMNRIWRGARLKSTDICLPEEDEDFIICSESNIPKPMKKLVFPDDYYVIDELIFLFLDAVKHSNGIKITNASNLDKKSVVWIKCYVEEGYIIIKFFNYLSEKFDDVMESIRSKKRVGKTHLEKFNIAVSYEEDPEEVQTLNQEGHIIGTKIAIPFFS